MKRSQIPRILSACFLTTGLLMGCQNDQMVTPTQTDRVTENDENAKTLADVKLVKNADDTLEYVKFGKFADKLAKRSNAYTYTEYTYDDSPGNLLITSKKYSKANNKLVHHKTYLIVNGRCISSKDITQQYSYNYKYNALGSLVEIKRYTALHTLTRQFSYKPILLNKQRLDKITDIGEAGPFAEYRFTYSSIPDKYPLNPLSTEQEMDKYLNIFGTFSDLLVQNIVKDELEGPDGYMPSNNYTYTLNADGYVTSSSNLYYPDINHSNYSEVVTEIREYLNVLQIP
ncbi:hypothetical protein [Dyadobacter sp. MSC1_007]|uniref:hypothetical protein n=1 Tax=Dyadobacter sp. MSC1_007 TaxID=2909264 RepID=UPI00202EC3B0|nr:hypothetical protein [Dyadobacter sp. MSC1_007]